MPKSRTCYKKLRSQVQCPLAFRFCFAEKIPFFGFNKKITGVVFEQRFRNPAPGHVNFLCNLPMVSCKIKCQLWKTEKSFTVF